MTIDNMQEFLRRLQELQELYSASCEDVIGAALAISIKDQLTDPETRDEMLGYEPCVNPYVTLVNNCKFTFAEDHGWAVETLVDYYADATGFLIAAGDINEDEID